MYTFMTAMVMLHKVYCRLRLMQAINQTHYEIERMNMYYLCRGYP